MFFLMKNDIFPKWEDINNIDGGTWSYRVTKKESDEVWNIFSSSVIGMSITKNEDDMKFINGISISPKINNCIIKIWNNNSHESDGSIFIEKLLNIKLNEGLYRKHQDQHDINYK